MNHNKFSIPNLFEVDPDKPKPLKPRVFEADVSEQEEVHYEEPSKANFTFILFILWLACAALSVFSYFSSACDYYTMFRRTDVAGSRVIGLQASIVAFWMLFTVALIATFTVKGPLKRLGCAFGVIFCGGIGLTQSVDSSLTSFGYQDYKLGALTKDDRKAEASVEATDDILSQVRSRQAMEVAEIDDAISAAREELEGLDRILAPALAAGTSLKKSYSANRETLTAQIQDLRGDKRRLLSGHFSEISQINDGQNKAKQAIASTNSSGVSRASRFIGLSTGQMIMVKTLASELCLIALAMVAGLTAWRGATATTSANRFASYGKLAGQIAGMVTVFYIAHSMFKTEAPRIEVALSGKESQVVQASTPAAPLESAQFNPLFGNPTQAQIDARQKGNVPEDLLNEYQRFDEDDLPVHNPTYDGTFVADPLDFDNFEDVRAAQVGYRRHSTFGSKRNAFRLPKIKNPFPRKPQTVMSRGVRIPPNLPSNMTPEIYRSILIGSEPGTAHIIAGIARVESEFRPKLYHYDNGGYAHGMYCLHGKWRKKDVDWMKRQPGGWRCPHNNLKALLRTLKDHEKYYPSSKRSWREKLARYNGGSKPNYKYADKVLKFARQYQPLFNQPNYL